MMIDICVVHHIAAVVCVLAANYTVPNINNNPDDERFVVNYTYIPLPDIHISNTRIWISIYLYKLYGGIHSLRIVQI